MSDDPYWIELIPKFNLYRFLEIDEFNLKRTTSQKLLYYKPIILVNGYNSSYLTWNYLAQRLWINGFRNIFALNLQKFTRSREDFLELIDDVINTILSVVNSFNSVSIIGHSIGGILTRYYAKLNEFHNIRKISLLITIASPYYEIMTYLRDFGFFFNHVFPSEMIDLFKGDNGLYSLSTVYQPVEFNKITMVNVDGAVKLLLGSDGLFRPQNPCEMINVTINQNHFGILRCPEISQLVREFLCNKVIIYKISLTKISFPKRKTGKQSYFYFKIRDGKEVQRYPANEWLKTTPNAVKTFKPYIIYSGKASKSKKEKIITISMFRKKIFNDEKLIEGKIQFKFTIEDSSSSTRHFKNNNVSFSINIISISAIQD